MNRRVDTVVIHTTDLEWGTVESVRHMHMRERDPPLVDIGYHYLVTNAFPTWSSLNERRPDPSFDGERWAGRDLDRDGDTEEHVGAHVKGWNRRSIGIALVGRGGLFTGRQIEEAVRLTWDVCLRHEIAVDRVYGHREIPGVNKTCPDLDMDYFRALVKEKG